MVDHNPYDHNQTLVPDSFMAIHSRHGRPTLKRDALEARYQLAEDLAMHIGEMASAVSEDDARGQRQAMGLARAGLLTAPAQVSEAEAEWVVRRVAELCGWPPPGSPLEA